MIELPNFGESFAYENGFYLSCDTSRVAKMLAHYELFKLSLDVPGDIVECGVFKGASLSRFAMMRELFPSPTAKSIYAFDTFGRFPETEYVPDQPVRSKFISDAGENSISAEQMKIVLEHKGIKSGVNYVEGDITDTVPQFISTNPDIQFSFINLDTDIYEPAKTILEFLYPRLAAGGVMILDDYGVFPGETKAVVEYFAGVPVEIRKLPFSETPSFIVKPG